MSHRARSVFILFAILLAIQPVWVSVSLAQEKKKENSDAAQKESDEYYRLLRLFADTLDQVDRNYVKDIDRKELVEAAIEGMLSKLDPYSVYIPETKLDNFQGTINSQFGGIGIQVSLENGELTVISPIYDSPAYKQGIIAGDVVVKIDETSTKDLSMQGAVKLMKGEIGTNVKVTVRRKDDEGNSELKEYEIRRSIIRLKTVLGDRRLTSGSWNYFLENEDHIGYIRLTTFSRMTANELKKALDELYENDVKGVIIDLRFNPGGLLSSAIATCDMFIDKGRIVGTEGKNSAPKVWDARERGTYDPVPMAVLINRYSASASEIFSACLKDNERAVIVGERSFGKGSVQNVIEMNDGKSALKLTTAGYHRPNGKNIHRFKGATVEDQWGVKPTEGFSLPYNRKENSDYLSFRSDRDVIGDSDNGQPDDEPFVDRQLNKAIEYLRGELNTDHSDDSKAESTGK